MLDLTYDKLNEDLGNPLYSSLGKDDDNEPMLSPWDKKSTAGKEMKVSGKVTRTQPSKFL